MSTLSARSEISALYVIPLNTIPGIDIFPSSRLEHNHPLSRNYFDVRTALGLFVLQWGRVSDKIGRRPVLLVGLFGLFASMISFGLSKSFVAIIGSRVIAGILNGNVGVAKTVVCSFHITLTDVQ